MKRAVGKPTKKLRPVRRRPLRITLTIDDGLASWLRALVKSPVGIFGNERETIIFALRQFIVDKSKPGSTWLAAMLPYLPEDIRRAVEDRSAPR